MTQDHDRRLGQLEVTQGKATVRSEQASKERADLTYEVRSLRKDFTVLASEVSKDRAVLNVKLDRLD